MRPDHRLSPKSRFAAVLAHMVAVIIGAIAGLWRTVFGMYGDPAKPKDKPPRRKRPPCNAWGKR